MIDDRNVFETIKGPDCVKCGTYLTPMKMFVKKGKELTRTISIMGWDRLEINGGETTDDWLCPRCKEQK